MPLRYQRIGPYASKPGIGMYIITDRHILFNKLNVLCPEVNREKFFFVDFQKTISADFEASEHSFLMGVS